MTELPPFRRLLRQDGPAIGMWLAAADAYVAEICAGAGLDWLLIDAEHAPNDLRTVLAQLQAIDGHPVHAAVRPPVGDETVIKQLLDMDVRTLVVPMVESVDQARALVAAVRYPLGGVRGVGSAFGRASRWSRVRDYLTSAHERITLVIQIESVAGLNALAELLAIDGIDGVFIGPADLAASMGYLGEPDHDAVVTAVMHAIQQCVDADVAVGVNAFDESRAREYVKAGVSFVLVGADVVLLARGSEDLANRYHDLKGES